MRSITRGKEERTEVMALTVQASAKMKGREIKNDSACTHCNRPGHDEAGCFELIGYPEWWGERPRNDGKAGGRGRGQYRTRGTASNNGRAQRGPARAHAVQNLGSSGGDIENSVMTRLSKEQWQTLVEMLNTSKVTSNESMTGKTKLNVWILDSGASNHMTGCLQHLSDVREVVGCPVGLPNGQTAMSTKEGTMRRLTDGLILENVLYVPQLNCNLISISQLSDESNCSVQFTSNLCAIQDHTSKMLIGAGERRDGLYFFREVPKVKAYKIEEINQLEVWHQRLGHPSWKTTQVERKHRHILNVARALRFQGNLPIDFWGECVLTAGYLINRTPSSILKGNSPYEVLHGHAPCYTHLRVFGSLCFARNRYTNGDKFATRSRRCVFVGYPYGQKGWRVYDLESHEFFVSRDVTFFENQFPFHEIEKQNDDVGITRTMLELPITEEDDMENQNNGEAACQNEPLAEITLDNEETHVIEDGEEGTNAVEVSAHIQPQNSHDKHENESLGRGCRVKYPSTRLQGYETNTVHKLSPSPRS
ncbi:hypothetical protein L195_g021334 [Trifolium pratense]|uniref:GAG-pre-integrase domain-containing protein n=1 Tax=Trifolium pratense TaxID=57577 RepID=A0A2K3N4W3_TRIPR|nr:hypothetical protein L195_g021334 [Trifolium pratense]